MKKLERLGVVLVLIAFFATIVTAVLVGQHNTIGVYRVNGYNVRVTKDRSLEVGTIPKPFVVKMKDGKIMTTVYFPVNHIGYYKITTEATSEWQAIYKKFFKT
jgi:hypothetical protein